MLGLVGLAGEGRIRGPGADWPHLKAALPGTKLLTCVHNHRRLFGCPSCQLGGQQSQPATQIRRDSDVEGCLGGVGTRGVCAGSLFSCVQNCNIMSRMSFMGRSSVWGRVSVEKHIDPAHARASFHTCK